MRGAFEGSSEVAWEEEAVLDTGVGAVSGAAVTEEPVAGRDEPSMHF